MLPSRRHLRCTIAQCVHASWVCHTPLGRLDKVWDVVQIAEIKSAYHLRFFTIRTIWGTLLVHEPSSTQYPWQHTESCEVLSAMGCGRPALNKFGQSVDNLPISDASCPQNPESSEGMLMTTRSTGPREVPLHRAVPSPGWLLPPQLWSKLALQPCISVMQLPFAYPCFASAPWPGTPSGSKDHMHVLRLQMVSELNKHALQDDSLEQNTCLPKPACRCRKESCWRACRPACASETCLKSSTSPCMPQISFVFFSN